MTLFAAEMETSARLSPFTRRAWSGSRGRHAPSSLERGDGLLSKRRECAARARGRAAFLIEVSG